MLDLKPTNLQSADQAYSGALYLHPRVFEQFCKNNIAYGLITGNASNKYVFNLLPANFLQEDQIGMGKFQRQTLKISVVDKIKIEKFQFNDEKKLLSFISMELNLEQSKNNEQLVLDDKQFTEFFFSSIRNQAFQKDLIFVFDYQGFTISAKILQTQATSLMAKENIENLPGIADKQITQLELKFIKNPNLKFTSSSQKAQNLFRSNFQFDQLGIGGLDKELLDIFRRAFASRRFPPSVLDKYGIKHVKGLLLYGPPGTGKTLIARQLSKVLQSKEPKIVNGPSIMSKFVGEAEKNIRDLFQDAINEQRDQGEDSQLHIIIFDEIDAICKQRGTSNNGTNVNDSVVNQLLSMIDGVDSLNNILVIGMTNRKDLIDEALLRPGRFEVHVEVSLPDEQGRVSIFQIHTANMKKNNLISKDVQIQQLANQTKNYTGAEIEAVVKSASSYSFERCSNLMDFSKEAKLLENSQVEKKDFEKALDEIKPQFGADTDKLEFLLRNQLINYGQNHLKIINILQQSIEQVRKGKQNSVHSILLEGPDGAGKTSLAAQAAKLSDFPFVKIISPEYYVGFNENSKVNAIVKIFDDAYRSTQSCIILDNIERLIEFVDLGPRFSNVVLQALLVLIKKMPNKKENRLLIIGTSSAGRILNDLEITKSFDIKVTVGALKQQKEIQSILSQFNIKDQDQIVQSIHEISIKRLLLIIDIVLNSHQNPGYKEFMECYSSIE